MTDGNVIKREYHALEAIAIWQQGGRANVSYDSTNFYDPETMHDS
jgi:hypothetical protein